MLRPNKIINILREELLRETIVWGVGAAGVIMICQEDETCFLQKRGDVHGGQNQWSYPSGGMPNTMGILNFNNSEEIMDMLIPTDIKEYEDLAIEEWKEETKMPFLGKIVDHVITTTINKFKFHLFVAICTLEEKENMEGNFSDEESEFDWEVDDDGWFTKEEIFGSDPIIDLWAVAFNDKAMGVIKKYL